MNMNNMIKWMTQMTSGEKKGINGIDGAGLKN